MLLDRVVLFCCFALMVCGLIIGLSLQTQPHTLDNLEKIFSIVSSIAVLATALITILTLNNWKHAFFFEKKYNSLRELEKVGIELISTASSQLTARRELEYLDSNSKDKDYFVELDESANSEFYEKIELYKNEAAHLTSILTFNELENFHFDYVTFYSRLQKIRVAIHTKHLLPQSPYTDWSSEEDQIIKLRNEIKKDLRQFWANN